jgi:hypothetical protein
MTRRGTEDRPCPPLGKRAGRRWPLLGCAVCVAALALVVGPVTQTLGQDTVLNLGRPTATLSTNAYFPLSGFHRVRSSVRAGNKAELLFLGAQGQFDRISAERWPLVKAVQQFGRLSGVRAIEQQCTTLTGGTFAGRQTCSLPTFDLSHMHFVSRYLTFVSKDLIRVTPSKTAVYQRLSSEEMRSFVRYSRDNSGVTCGQRSSDINAPTTSLAETQCTDLINYVIASIKSDGERTLPLLAVGNYVQTLSQDVHVGDFTRTIPLTPPPQSAIQNFGYDLALPFAAVQSALGSGKSPTTTSHLVEDVNAETNIITALICHADGLGPQSVCGRHVIRVLLRQIK